MNSKLKTALAVSAALMATQAFAGITFYEREGFRGRAFTTEKQVRNFERFGFSDRASSVIVDRGRWEVCEDVQFGGHCVVLRRGNYDSLRAMGLNNRVSSVRPAQPRSHAVEAPAPTPVPVYEYRQRPNERTYEANVTAVRAVVGPPERRCWVEKQEVVQQPRSSEPNIGGAIVGGILGGVLGHQVGGGRGKDVATAGGAVAGAAIGANVGRESGPAVVSTRDVQRCERGASGPPQYYDVTYEFRGMEHHAQMSAPPGPTIVVNASGVPRM